MVKYSFTRRGGRCLIYRDNTYYVNNEHGTKTFWVCSHYTKTVKCRARCVTDFDGNLTRSTGNHNHPPNKQNNASCFA